MRTILSILSLILITACSSPDFKAHYFQVSDFETPKHYIFIDQNEEGLVHHMKMYYKVEDEDTIFYTEGLNQDLKLVEMFIEQVSDSGARMLDYYFVNYDKDSSGVRTESRVVNSGVYAFNEKGFPLKWKVVINSGNGIEKYTKNRSYDRVATVDVLGERKSCVVLKDEMEMKGGWGTNTYIQESFYAKGMGLVKYKRYFPGGYVADFQLMEIR